MIISSWATSITIHKRQGKMLKKTVIDLDCFGKNMEYVTLSGLKTLNGLALSKINVKRFTNYQITSKRSVNWVRCFAKTVKLIMELIELH